MDAHGGKQRARVPVTEVNERRRRGVVSSGGVLVRVVGGSRLDGGVEEMEAAHSFVVGRRERRWRVRG